MARGLVVTKATVRESRYTRAVNVPTQLGGFALPRRQTETVTEFEVVVPDEHGRRHVVATFAREELACAFADDVRAGKVAL